MLTIHPEKIYISSANVDMRKSYRRLVCDCRAEFQAQSVQ